MIQVNGAIDNFHNNVSFCKNTNYNLQKQHFLQKYKL